MNRTLKNILITLAIIGGVIIVFKAIATSISEGLSSAADTLGDAYGTKCEETQSWIIRDFKVQEYECIGFAGPHFYRCDVYNNDELIAENVYRDDSCKVHFQAKEDLFVKINVCDKSVEQLKPSNKLVLNSIELDSVILYSKKLNTSKKIKDVHYRKIIEDWTKSNVLDYRDKPFDSIFHPSYHYKVRFYANGKSADLLTFNHLVADHTKWVYEISNYPDTLYFKNIWNKN
ncbi:hypothetical protein SAMN06265375_1182 [Muriicola jejuensis]|uniref:Uncharacterized protein n=1 Tax=Muriicola jejuensis TaxID=504488 RepID=A0A6P0UIR8_9FLAO|nr:hypothetical protein [Muriicola jejuensis]NER11798.1 hypothetical protein [Muriicola jejuensis]SMP27886.1 hypothetical protein SAMN06265375_1182 [Muriicola jejuensis]